MQELKEAKEPVLVKTEIRVERKVCTLELRQNARGKLLRIQEHRGDREGRDQRMDKVIFPGTPDFLRELIESLQGLLDEVEKGQ